MLAHHYSNQIKMAMPSICDVSILRRPCRTICDAVNLTSYTVSEAAQVALLLMMRNPAQALACQQNSMRRNAAACSDMEHNLAQAAEVLSLLMCLARQAWNQFILDRRMAVMMQIVALQLIKMRKRTLHALPEAVTRPHMQCVAAD